MTVEIGPLMLQAIMAGIPLALAIVALLRQIWTDQRVSINSDRLDRHGTQIGDIKRQINGGGVPPAPVDRPGPHI